MVQAFLKKWWVESDFKAPNLPLSLWLKVSGCHYNSIYNNTWTKQVKQLSKQRQTQWSKCQRQFYVTHWQKNIFETSWLKQVTFDEKIMIPGLLKTKTISWMSIVLAHWNNSPRVDMSFYSHYPNFEPTNYCSFSLMLCAKRRRNRYICHSLWFDPIGARIRNLPHSRDRRINLYTTDAVH